jgi:hypothetical protein
MVIRRLVLLLGIAGMITIAGASLDRVYDGQLLLYLVAGAALGSVLVSLVLRRAPSWVVAPVSLLALGGYGVYAVEVSASAGGVPGGLVTLALDAARNALPRLLTALIPVAPQPDTVLAPVVLAWLAGLAAGEIATRTARAALALLPPALLYVGALVLVGPNSPVVLWQPLVFVALASASLAAGSWSAGTVGGSRGPGPRSARPAVAALPAGSAWSPEGVLPRDPIEPRRDGARRLRLRLRGAGGLGVAMVAVLGVVVALAPVVANRINRVPGDPRALVAPPVLDAMDENPLIRISGWAANPGEHLFDVALLSPQLPGPGSSPGSAPTPGSSPTGTPEAAPAAAASPDLGNSHDTRLRLAVLEEWDGVTWHTAAQYRGAGRDLPFPSLPGGVTGDTADSGTNQNIIEQIRVDALDGRLLPAVPDPRRIDGVRVSFDQDSGTLLQTDPLTAGESYTVTSENPAVDVSLLPGADVPSGPTVAHLLAVGDSVPADLSRLAGQIATGAPSPYQRALALQSFLAEHYRYALDAPSGHAYPNLRFFLFDDPRAGGQRGTSEQFAAAFAALGRLMGLPTRVVVGFDTPAGGGPVTAADALAWPEVLFSGVGWVAFDPLPKGDTPPKPLQDQNLPQPNPPPTPPETIVPTPRASSAAPALGGHRAAGTTGDVVGEALGAGAVSLVVLVVLGGFVLALLNAAVRRRRMSTGPASQRVLGAWDHVLDTLYLAGTPPPPHLSATGVAAHAATLAGPSDSLRHSRGVRSAIPPLDDLVTRVNAVGFGPPAEPGPAMDETATPSGLSSALSSAASSDEEIDANTARMIAISFARAVRARRSFLRRVLWMINPRPLRRRDRWRSS